MKASLPSHDYDDRIIQLKERGAIKEPGKKKKLKVISAYILSLAVFLAPGLAISGTKRLKSRSDAAKIALN